jgi:hypothetical protein
MKHERQAAFDEWWADPKNEGLRFTPTEVWDAACEWMKEELVWRIEQCVEKAEL